MARTTFERYQFSVPEPDDWTIVVIDKKTKIEIFQCQSVLEIPAMIAIPGIGLTFNQLCKQNRVQLDVRHRSLAVSQIPPLSSLFAYYVMLIKQINYLLTPNYGPIDIMFEPMCGKDELYGCFWQSAKHNGLGGLDIPTMGFYKDIENNRYLLADEQLFDGQHLHYERYIHSLGLSAHKLENPLVPMENIDKYTMRGSHVPYVLCPVYSDGIPDHYTLYLNGIIASIKAYGTKRIITPAHGMPLVIAEHGVLITLDDPDMEAQSNLVTRLIERDMEEELADVKKYSTASHFI